MIGKVKVISDGVKDGVYDPTLDPTVSALLEAAQSAQCTCTIRERESGHVVGCWMPELIEALAKFDTGEPLQSSGREALVTVEWLTMLGLKVIWLTPNGTTRVSNANEVTVNGPWLIVTVASYGVDVEIFSVERDRLNLSSKSLTRAAFLDVCRIYGFQFVAR